MWQDKVKEVINILENSIFLKKRISKVKLIKSASFKYSNLCSVGV